MLCLPCLSCAQDRIKDYIITGKIVYQLETDEKIFRFLFSNSSLDESTYVDYCKVLSYYLIVLL